MSVLKRKYMAHIAQLEAKRVPLTSYQCPACQAQIKALQPDGKGRTYDTMVVCPFCEVAHFRVVAHNGKVATSPMRA